MQKLRSQLEQLQSELLFSRSGSAALEELQVGLVHWPIRLVHFITNVLFCIFQLLQQKVSLLELKNSELYCELKEREMSCEQLAQRAVAAQVSCAWIVHALFLIQWSHNILLYIVLFISALWVHPPYVMQHVGVSLMWYLYVFMICNYLYTAYHFSVPSI